MAGNFTFMPYGISTLVTVGVATTTFSINVALSAGTSTLSVVAGAFYAGSVRIANLGSVPAGLIFSPGGASLPTLTANNGMQVIGGTVESFRIQGMPVMQALSAGTTTLCITPGEGM